MNKWTGRDCCATQERLSPEAWTGSVSVLRGATIGVEERRHKVEMRERPQRSRHSKAADNVSTRMESLA
jgi:hypothetical protein